MHNLLHTTATKDTQTLFRRFFLDPRPDRTCREILWKSPAVWATESSVLDLPVHHVPTQVQNKLCQRHGVPPTAVTSVERFHINHIASATRALICLVTMILPFNLETGAHYCPWSGQPSYQFWCSWGVSFSTYAPTPVRRTICDIGSRPWPLTLEITVLVGDTGLRWPSRSEDMMHFQYQH